MIKEINMLLKNFNRLNSAKSIHLKSLVGMVVIILLLSWIGNRFKLPLNSDVEKRRNEFIEMLPVVFPNDSSIRIEFSGKSGGLVFVDYDGGYPFNENLLFPNEEYVKRVESFGFDKSTSHPQYYCKNGSSIEFDKLPSKRKWLIVWHYHNDDCS